MYPVKVAKSVENGLACYDRKPYFILNLNLDVCEMKSSKSLHPPGILEFKQTMIDLSIIIFSDRYILTQTISIFYNDI